MPSEHLSWLAAVLAFLFLSEAAGRAQTYEAVGTRAQGMAGAFVAVADDATATWWNPAGLATGSYFSAVIEQGRGREPANVPPSGPAVREDTTAISVVVPALGASYYRLRISEIATPSSTGGGAANRQEAQGPRASLRTLSVSQFGITTGQSLGDHVVVASTVRLLRGGVAGESADGRGSESLGRAAAFPVSTETRGDVDLGAMVSLGAARLGASLKHLTQPAFGEGETSQVLRRQVRAGVSLSARGAGPLSAAVLAVDADLTRTATAIGDVRHLAAGVELAAFGGRVAVRGGASRHTTGEPRPSASVGASVGVRAGLFADGAITIGPDESKRGWAVAARLTF